MQFYVSDDKIYNTNRSPIKCILINCVIITACGQMKTNIPTYNPSTIHIIVLSFIIILYIRDWLNLILHFYLYSRAFFSIKTISTKYNLFVFTAGIIPTTYYCNNDFSTNGFCYFHII